MNFFERRRILKKANFLDLIPVRLQEHKEEEDGKVTVIVPKFKNDRFRNWFVPKRRSTHFRIHLDPNGSEVWKKIDGKRSVAQISEELHAGLNDGDELSSVQTRVTKFMSYLYDQRYVSFTVLTNPARR